MRDSHPLEPSVSCGDDLIGVGFPDEGFWVCVIVFADKTVSYVRKLVTELSGGVFGYLDSVLERHSFDEFGELI